MCVVADEGNTDLLATIAEQVISPMCHARWLTTAARVLRYWVSERVGTDTFFEESLERTVGFIVNVYYRVSDFLI